MWVSNSVGGRRTDELDLYVDWSRYFFHLGGECRPDTGRLPGKQCGGNSENICLPSKVRDTVARSRNSENDCLF